MKSEVYIKDSGNSCKSGKNDNQEKFSVKDGVCFEILKSKKGK
jgi:hypothetical protein